MADAALILGLAGIGGTVTVGVASPWLASRFAAKQQARAFQHERTMRDEEELRAVLDQVAASLDRCFSAMGDAYYKGIVMLGGTIGQDDEGRALLRALGDAAAELRLLVGRLAIRLGSGHAVKLAAAEAQTSLAAFSSTIWTVAAMREQANLTGDGPKMEAAMTEFSAARSSFVELARTYAGSRLPLQLEAELALIPSNQAPPAGGDH